MTRRTFAATLALVATPLVPVFAHEGHDHKVLGTVTEIAADRIAVKASKDGKVSSVAIVAATKITRGKTKLAATDIKVGDRVVVNIGAGKEPLTAKAIEVGTPTTSTR
jgi:hypothetical protein